ncbi:MAG: aldehyde dehydrogenase family protein [Acidobacteria bacterium]|nr:aldehyde dehydrogenase family protein [Acidobacteriota bacterium]
MSSPSKATIKPGKLFIGGEWCEAKSGKTFSTINPAKATPIIDIADADAVDVDLAVSAARTSFQSGAWAKMSGSERGEILWRIGDLIMKYADELAELETLDVGKPILESRRIDIPFSADCFRYFAGAASKLQGDTIPVRSNCFTYTLREPLGVVALIVPWNFPLLLATRKVAPALAAGNTVILKPAPNSPLTAIRLAEICAEAGLPAGVLNLLTGSTRELGQALVDHSGVDGVSFTGSTAVGQEILRRSANTLKHVEVELGGKSPNVIFADADIEAAVKGAISAIFYNCGEVCTAGSRLFVEESVHEKFVEQIVARAKKLTPGDPLDPKTRLGPVVSKEQMERVLSYIESGKAEGARLLTGGSRASVGNGDGYFIEPTVFDQVDNKMKIAQEEIFGPVLSTITFRDLDEAIAKSNDTIYGLAAAVWTRDIKKAHRLARAIKAGTVWINTYNMFDSASPYGGYKMSGFGREQGLEAFNFYTQTKTVWIDLNE